MKGDQRSSYLCILHILNQFYDITDRKFKYLETNRRKLLRGRHWRRGCGSEWSCCCARPWVFPCSGTLKTHKIIAFNDVLWITKKVGTETVSSWDFIDHFGIVCYGILYLWGLSTAMSLKSCLTCEGLLPRLPLLPYIVRFFCKILAEKLNQNSTLYLIEVDV